MEDEVFVYPIDGETILPPIELPETGVSEVIQVDTIEEEAEKTELSENIANRIIESLQESVSVSENDESNPEIDYTQQLADINNSITLLRDDINKITVSLNEIQESIVMIPDNQKEMFQQEIDFHYITMSLYLGLLVVILFFMGLKK